MKININSWHYKYLRKNNKFPKENLCSYLWCLFILMFEHTTWLTAAILLCWAMGLTWESLIEDISNIWMLTAARIGLGAFTILFFVGSSIAIVMFVGWLENKISKLKFPKFFSKLKIKCIKVEYTDK